MLAPSHAQGTPLFMDCHFKTLFLEVPHPQPTMSIQHLTGDATRPVGDGNKIIAHVCNDGGKWGKGFIPAVSKRWWQPEAEYRKWALRDSLKLGSVHLVPVRKGIFVANMVAQHDNEPSVRCDALLECFKELGFHAHQRNASIHMPRIGGGKWDAVEKQITDTLPGTDVFVYDLPESIGG